MGGGRSRRLARGALAQQLAIGEPERAFLDLRPGRQQHSPVHGVFELAHIAGPPVAEQAAARFVGNLPLGHPIRGRVFLHEVLSQRRDVAWALT